MTSDLDIYSAASVPLSEHENGSEMGVYNELLDPIKRDGLRAKIEEFMPFGLLPHFLFET